MPINLDEINRHVEAKYLENGIPLPVEDRASIFDELKRQLAEKDQKIQELTKERDHYRSQWQLTCCLPSYHLSYSWNSPE